MLPPSAHRATKSLFLLIAYFCSAIGEAQSVHAESTLTKALAGLQSPAPLACMAPVGGATGCLSGPATMGNQSGTDKGAGNPIDVITGNKYQRENDLPALPGVLGLEIVRHYNSMFAGPHLASGIFGHGWKLSYETDLYVVGNTIQIMQADGTRVMFNRDPADPTHCASADPAHGTLTLTHTPRGEEYVWRWVGGRELRFDARGKLVQIAVPTGEFVTQLRDPHGALLQVTDPQGRTLHLHYPNRAATAGDMRFGGIERIDSPAGVFSYRYGSAPVRGIKAVPAQTASADDATAAPAALRALPDGDAAVLRANLVAVSFPDHGSGRHYHYEDGAHPTYITGISAVGIDAGKPVAKRLGTYLYDRNGRAILTAQGPAAELQAGGDGHPLQPARLVPGSGIGQVTLDYSTPGTTIIANSLGQQTTYRHAIIGGEFRLLEVRGVGCSKCGPTNRRYGYDRLGHLTSVTRLDWTGAALDTEETALDPLGRVLRIGSVGYRNAKPSPVQWHTRLVYGSDDTAGPILISRASVLSGRQHVQQITYNRFGQIVALTESGWTPVSASGPALALERTTHWRYASIRGRSLLVAIDGALANGSRGDPGDSDVTQIGYDAAGNFALSITAPGNFTSRITALDARGHPTMIEADDGINPVQRSRIERDVMGRIVSVTQQSNLRAADPEPVLARLLTPLRRWIGGGSAAQRPLPSARTTHLQYDAYGRLVRLARGDGTWHAIDYDAADRPISARDQDGNRVFAALDGEGQVLSTLTSSADPAAPLHALTRYQRDQRNLLSTSIAADGGISSYVHDARSGLLATSTDAIGRVAHYRYNARGQVDTVVQNPDSPAAAITRLGHLGDSSANAIDNHSAGSAAITAVTAPNGALTRRSIDDFGRTTFLDSADSGALSNHYDNADRLVESTDANGNQSRYSYDHAGRLLEKRTVNPGTHMTAVTVHRYRGLHMVALANAAQSTGYNYDADGNLTAKVDLLTRLAANGEPDSAVVRLITRYRYDAFGRGIAETLPSGETLATSYGPTGAVAAIALLDAQGQSGRILVHNIHSNALSGLNSFTHGNGLITQYAREAATGHLTQLTVSAPARGAKQAFVPPARPFALIGQAHAAPLTVSAVPTSQPFFHYAQGFTFDLVARITAISTQRGATQVSALTRYGYDELGHLASERTAGTFSRWHYDSAGNRATHSSEPIGVREGANIDLPPTTQEQLRYQPNSNRLVSVADSNALHQYAYDPAGNPISTAAQTSSYDVIGRLQQVTNAGGTVARYRYNASGERIAKQTYATDGRSSTVYYQYRDQQLAMELDQQGNVTAQYVYLAGVPVAKLESGRRQDNGNDTPGAVSRIYALHPDHLGTPQFATDRERRVVWSAAYDAFGQARVETAGITQNLRFPGQYFDAETGRHYNYFRDYDPRTGRYLQSDPIGVGGGINTYGYAVANPLTNVDPSGLVVFISGHPAAQLPLGVSLGAITSPTSYHLAIGMVPDRPGDFNTMLGAFNGWNGTKTGGIYGTVGGQPSGGKLVTAFNFPGDNKSHSDFFQIVLPPNGVSDTDFIKSIISAAKCYDNQTDYTIPSLPSGRMAANEYNSNSYVAGVLRLAGVTVPLQSGGKFLTPGYLNPLPICGCR